MTRPDALALCGGPPTRSRFLPFHRPCLGPGEEAEVLAALRSGWLTMGPRVQRLETAFCEMLGAPHALAVNSCTAAIHLALLGLEIGAGDEVVTTPISFASTANVLVHVGATPVFADVEPDTLNLDPRSVAERLTPRTRAILPVHMYGHPCDMDALAALAERHGLLLVEDAAHALEATWQGRRMGTASAAAAFSLYATKNVTTGEGGVLVTARPELAEAAETLRNHGLSRGAWKRYGAEGFQHWEILAAGYNYKLSDVLAAIGLAQLARLEGFWAERRRLVGLYEAALAECAEIERPVICPAVRSAHHLYSVRLRPGQLRWTRDQVLAAVQAEGIGLGVHFRALHLQPYYRRRFGFAPGLCPVAEGAAERLFSLPLYPGLTEADVADVVAALRKVLAVARGQAFPGEAPSAPPSLPA